MSKYKYKCVDCETVYYTTEDRPPPTPRWSDHHKCVLKKVKEDE